MFNDLNAKIDFKLRNTVFKGWDLRAIESDLKGRDTGDGFEEVALRELQRGETPFEEISGNLVIANAEYIFQKGNFVLKDIEFHANMSGSLREWTLNSSFKAKFNAVNIPALRFSLMGNLDSPNLAVDVDEIVDNYDKYWASVRAEKKAEADALKKRLDDAMVEQQSRANKTTMRLNSEIFKEYEERKQRVFDSKTAARYEQLDREIDEIRKILDEIRMHRKNENFNDELIAKLVNLNTSAAGRVEQIERSLQDIYFLDGKVGVNTLLNQISELVQNARVKVEASQDSYIAYTKRLASIETNVNLVMDEETSRIRNDIKVLLEEMDKLGEKAGNEYVNSQKSGDFKELNEYLQRISDTHGKVSDLAERLNDKERILSEYMEKLVSEAENEYFKVSRKEEEERQRKIEEAQKPLVTAVEEAPVVSEDEVGKELIVIEEEIRVLNFGGEATETAPAVSGSVTKPTGVIRRK